MRIFCFFALIVTLTSLMLPFVSYADCNPNSTGAAAQFLVGCADGPQNAIDPES